MMARGACTFRQHDVTRALRATVAAGREVRRIEIGRDGKIVLVITEAEPAADDPRPEDQIVL